MNDNTIQSVWDAKDRIAKECEYDPKKLAEMLKATESSQDAKTVDYHQNTVAPHARANVADGKGPEYST